MTRVDQVPSTYDRMYQEGGHEGIYHLPYWRSQYYPLFKSVLRILKRHRIGSVLEVGCGNGAFAHLLAKKSRICYSGFDFSEVAVRNARFRCRQALDVYVADALEPTSYARDYESIVCTEVLEHIPDDLSVVRNWRSGAFCVCSVPNFDSKYHERFFVRAQDVADRYGLLIDITAIESVPVPYLADLGWRSVAAGVVQNLSKPRRLARIVCPSFSSRRNWFVFAGKKR